MARSPTEQIRELAQQLAILTERDAERGRVLDRLAARIDRVEEQVGARLEALEAQVTGLRVENAALKQQLQDHVALYQEGDRRRWGLVMLLAGAALSLASGLIVTLARK